jgi:adenosylhomocysteine nucleosidase
LNAAGVVAALAAEARALAPTPGRDGTLRRDANGYAVCSGGMLLLVSGIGQTAAAAAATRLVDAGAGALVSWGLAGGLSPSLEAGAVCLPQEVIGPDGTHYVTAGEWRETLFALVAAHRPVTRGSLLTSVSPIATCAAKAAAHRDTGAVAVDMESSAVARVARANASKSGEVRIRRLFLGLVRSPVELLPLLRLAKRYRSAIRSLQAVASLLEGPGPARPPASQMPGGPGLSRAASGRT